MTCLIPIVKNALKMLISGYSPNPYTIPKGSLIKINKTLKKKKRKLCIHPTYLKVSKYGFRFFCGTNA